MNITLNFQYLTFIRKINVFLNCQVNKQLERMGYSIGQRLIEDFLARTNCARCVDLRDTADKIQARKAMNCRSNPYSAEITLYSYFERNNVIG